MGGLKHNLLSIRQLCDNGLEVVSNQTRMKQNNHPKIKPFSLNQKRKICIS